MKKLVRIKITTKDLAIEIETNKELFHQPWDSTQIDYSILSKLIDELLKKVGLDGKKRGGITLIA